MSHRWTAVSLKRRSGMQDWRSRVTQTSTSRQTLWLIWRLVSLWCLLRSCSTLCYAAQGGSKGPLIIYRLGRGRGKGRRVFWEGTESFRRNGRGISHANRVLRGGGGEDGNRKLTVDYWLLTADEGMERHQHTTGPKGGMEGYFFVTQPKSSDFFPPPLLVINNDRSQCVEETLVCDHSNESWKEKKFIWYYLLCC